MAKSDRFNVQKTEAEWRNILTPAQFQVARQEGTERAFTSPLNHEKREGIFHCVGCGSPLWSSADKFDSWTDWKLLYPRTECHCATCGAHQGHVFPDGPAPTGQRWCINGVVLVFKAKDDPAG